METPELTALADERPLDLAPLLIPLAPARGADNGTALEGGGPARHPVPEGGGALVGPRPPVQEETGPDGGLVNRSEDCLDLGPFSDSGQVHT